MAEESKEELEEETVGLSETPKKEVSRVEGEKEHDEVEAIREMLLKIEKYGLDEESMQQLASNTGTWNSVQQLMVTSYIKNLRYKMRILHRSMEVFASRSISTGDVAKFAQAALEEVGLREWRKDGESRKED